MKTMKKPYLTVIRKVLINLFLTLKKLQFTNIQKLVFLFVCSLVIMDVNAQTYYKMKENGGGDGECLANSKTWLNYWGIQFITGSKVRATVSNKGSWYFAAPSSTYSPEYINAINTRLTTKPNIAIGTDKELAAKGFRLTDIDGDAIDYGKFYLGRNSNPTLTARGWLRLGSAGGIALWGHGNAETNDSPTAILKTDGSLDIYNNMGFFLGIEFLHIKRGRNNDPTIYNFQYYNSTFWLRFGSKTGIYLWGNEEADNNNTPTMSLIGRKVGIGTNEPALNLEVSGNGIRMTHNNIEVVTSPNAARNAGWAGTRSKHNLCLGADKNEAIYIDTDQRVYLGLTTEQIHAIKADYKNKYDLFVDKGILSEDYGISPKSTWSDFVFIDGYQLPKLSYVANFISQNKHLPDVPSAQEVAKNGYSQHDMNKVLLQKVEELTLYIIEQRKLVNKLREPHEQ